MVPAVKNFHSYLTDMCRRPREGGKRNIGKKRFGVSLITLKSFRAAKKGKEDGKRSNPIHSL